MQTLPTCHIANTRLVAVRNPELARAQRRVSARRRPSLAQRAAHALGGWFRG